MMNFIYSAFLMSGVYKTLLLVFKISSIDITLVLGLLLVMKIITDLVLRKFGFKKDIIIILSLFLFFVFSLIITLNYTISEKYCYIKLFKFSTCVIAFMYPLLIKKININNLLDIIVVQIMFFSGAFIFLYQFYYKSNVQIFSYMNFDPAQIGGMSLQVGFFIGFALLLSIIQKRTLRAIIFFIFLILTGAKGPIIFSCLSIIIMIPFIITKRVSIKVDIKKKHGLILILCLIILISLGNITGKVKYVHEMAYRSVSRLAMIFSDDKGASVNDRIEHIKTALKYIADKPVLGYGIGSYNYIVYGIDGRGYPHNIILELWFEAGLMGLLSFILLYNYVIIRTYIYKCTNMSILLIYQFLTALTSSNLSDLRFFFAFISITFLISCNQKINVINLRSENVVTS